MSLRVRVRRDCVCDSCESTCGWTSLYRVDLSECVGQGESVTSHVGDVTCVCARVCTRVSARGSVSSCPEGNGGYLRVERVY